MELLRLSVFVLLQLLLLSAQIEPLVCLSRDFIKPNRIQNSKTSDNESLESNSSSANTDSLSANPSYSIFKTGTGFKLFNNTLDPDLTSINHMQNDEQPSDQKQLFKVQRSPDGKLNLVFNDFLIFQNASETTTRNPVITFPGGVKRRPQLPQTESRAGTFCNGNVYFDGQTFCTDADNYPDLSKFEMKEREKLDREFKLFFGEDYTQPSNFSERTDFGIVEYLCTTREQIVYPKKGLTKEKEWLFIVNDDKYKQGIRTEYCEKENVKCHYADHLPGQFEPVCKQFYIYRSLIAIKNNSLEKQDFQWPSCCKCALNSKSYENY